MLASITYQGEIFPFMSTFIHTLAEHAYQNRTVALVEAGSWAPTAAKVMAKELEGMKDITLAQNKVTVLGSLNDASRAQIEVLADELPSSDISLLTSNHHKGDRHLCGGFCLSAGDDEIWAGVVDGLGD
ncbi:MAG: hypothetical protein ACLU0O_12740 [Collinsella sp.]